MKPCLIIAYLIIIASAPVFAQTGQQKAHSNNFVYTLSDHSPATGGFKILDSLIHLASPVKLIKFIMYGDNDSHIDYNLIYLDGSQWIHQSFSNKKIQRDSISFLISSKITVEADTFNAHGIYFHTGTNPLTDKQQDRYGYYLVKGEKIVQSLMCETPFREVDNKDLQDLMQVFNVFDQVRARR